MNCVTYIYIHDTAEREIFEGRVLQQLVLRKYFAGFNSVDT